MRTHASPTTFVSTVLLTIALASTASAQGTVSGTVTNVNGGANLAGIAVQLVNSAGSVVANSNNTGAGGTYTTTPVAAGSYLVRTINVSGFVNKVHNGALPGPSSSDADCFFLCGVQTLGTTVTVPATGTVTVNFALAAGASISGNLNTSPNPPLGASVTLYNSSGFSTGLSMFADAAGNFKSPGLPVGTFYLRAIGTTQNVGRIYPNILCVGCNSMAPSQLASLIVTGTPLVITSAALMAEGPDPSGVATQITNVNLTLPVGASITGQVTSGGVPVVGVNIGAFTQTGTQVSAFGTVTVAPNGTYSLGPLETGSYQVAVTNNNGQNVIEQIYALPAGKTCLPCFSPTGGDLVAVTLGNPTPNINLSLATGGQITGNLKRSSDNTNIVGASVRVTDQGSPFATVRTVVTNGSGDFTVSGLPSSTYFLLTGASSLGFIDEVFDNIRCVACNPSVGVPQVVTAGGAPLANRNFVLDNGGQITGRITDAATTAGISNIGVVATPLSGVFANASILTDGAGNYAFRGLPDDTYFVRTSAPSSRGYTNEFYPDFVCPQCPGTSGTAIVIAGANTQANKDIALSTGGSISGTVTDSGAALMASGTVGSLAAGTPIAGVTVTVSYANGGLAGSATTDDLGRYSVGGLATGQYYLVTSNTFGYINLLYNNIVCNGCSTTGGTKVDVTAPSATPGINFALSTGGVVTGRVTDAGVAGPNNGLADVTVTIYNGTLASGSAKTNSNGDYVIQGVPTGTYTAKATTAPGFIEQIYNGIACLNCSPTIGATFTVTQGSGLFAPYLLTAGATTPSINFSLVRGSTISGKVTDVATGSALSGVSVSISDGFTTVANVVTNSAGDYTSPGFPAGTFFVRTTFNSGGFINELFDNIPCLSCQVLLGTPVVIPAGPPAAITGKDLALARGGSIEGTVLKQSDNSPVPTASVSVYTSGGTFVGSNAAASNGTYAVRGLPADSYFAVTGNTSGYINEVFDNLPCTSCTATTGTAIVVTAGAATGGRNFLLAQGGIITGTVTNQANGQPIAGVTVQIFTSTGQSLPSPTTNALGVFTTNAGLPDGQYFARTSNTQGFIDVLYSAIPCAGCVATTGTPINVTAGSTTSGINFGLATGGQISGTVRAAVTAVPLANVTVSIFTADGKFVKSGQTNVSGLFNITGLAGNTYYARTTNTQSYIDQLYSGKSPTGPIGAGTPIAVTAGATTLNINFDLAVGGRILGRITDAATSAALANVGVQFYNAGGFFIGSGFSTATGDYRSLGGLATGLYYVRTSNPLGYVDEVYNNIACPTCITSGSPVSVTAGSDTTGVDFGLVMGGRISGTITDAVTLLPIANATVRVFSSTGEPYGTTISGSNGQFITSSGLPTGRYYINAGSRQGYVPQAYNNKECPACAPLTGDPIDVAAGATAAGKNFALNKGGLIGGRVTSGGVPLSGVNVAIFNNININVSNGTSDGDGNYLIFSGLPNGSYFAKTFNGQGLVDELYNNAALGSRPNQGTGITVTVPQTTANIDFALDTGGRISGRVTDSAMGLPLAGVIVNVADSTGTFVTSAVTDQAGGYITNGGLPAGNFFVFTRNSQGYIDKLHSGTTCLVCNPTLGTPVPVTVGNTTPNIDFALAIGGRISGRITSTDTGAAIFNAVAAVYTSTGAFAGLTGTNGLGDYTTNTGLPAGTYTVRTFNLKGFVDELHNNRACAPCDPLTGDPITVTVGSTTPGINFVLDTGGLVSGYAIDSTTNAPIEGVTVSFYLQPGNTYSGTSRPTDANGYFAMSLPVGTYNAQPDAVNGYVRPPGTSVTAAAVGGVNGSALNNITVGKGGETGGIIFPLAACTAPTLSPTSLATVTRGFAATRTVSATGSAGPYTFSISDGTLTPGLTLNANGTISGMPTALGTANFTVAASGPNSCAGTQTFNQLTCGVSFSAAGGSFTSAGSPGVVNVAATSADCAWSVTGGASWLTVATSATSGTGNGVVPFLIAPNTLPTARTATLTLGTQTFTITQGGTVTTEPFGLIDTPADNLQNVTGSIAVTGWALDDLQVTRVEIWRDPVSGEAQGQQLFIGNATQVEGSRPDVQQLYPTYPFSSRAGWGYMLLTNFLPNQGNGTVRLYAYARDLDGKSTLLGTRTLVTTNTSATLPFGAIDTPAQGGTVSGNAYVNFGWALTPLPKTIPIDGSTIHVYIDGVDIGTVTYNNARSDIQTLFPGYNNTNSAVGYRAIDTTQLADGVHTIAWVATDNQGAAEGMGSRFFTVANGSSVTAGSRTEQAGSSTVIARPPAEDAAPAPSVEALEQAGEAHVVIQRQLQRLEFELGSALCAYTGHLVAGGRFEPLPFGTTIKDGTFYWQPGAAYFGTYEMVFTGSCGTVRLRVVLQP